MFRKNDYKKENSHYKKFQPKTGCEFSASPVQIERKLQL